MCWAERRLVGKSGAIFITRQSLGREGGVFSRDTGCQLVSRRPSLAEEQWGSLLSPLPWPVSPPVERDKREGIWLSWHLGGRSGPAKADNSGTLCSENSILLIVQGNNFFH